MTTDKIGRIIWHDLFTKDLKRSMDFYGHVAGWTYVTEHATDFAWGGGEKDFVLALRDNEAGAGITDTPPNLLDGWIAYIEVPDVDATTILAEKLGGRIVRKPFEVPGVGRNALLNDPNGARFGLALSRHSFPAPTSQFDAEIYSSGTEDFPSAFYEKLFDWQTRSIPSETLEVAITGPRGIRIANSVAEASSLGSHSRWIPSLKTAHFDTALKRSQYLGADLLFTHLDPRGQLIGSVLQDTCNAVFYLQHSPRT